MPIRIDNRGGSIGSAVNGGTAGSVLFVDADGLMGQENPGFTWDGTTLTAAGNIVTNELISHNGDLNTYTQYLTDEYRIVAGGETLGIFHEDGSQDYVKLGDGGDVDINLNDDVFVEGSSGNVGIGVTNPDSKLEVSGDIHLTTDADKLLFGTASDASIYFDATDLIINSENITANDEVHFTNFDAYTFDNNITTTADIVADGTITINSNIKIPGAMFWVEEIGTLTTGLQFSWGNGGTGNWGIYQPVDGKVIGMSINVDNDTATADTGQVDIAVNGTAAGGEYHVHNPGAANSGSSVTFGTPLSFSAGDMLTATTTVTPVDGTTADVIIAFWVVYD